MLLFTLMFSFTSYAEWTKVSKNSSGTEYYVDFERIRKVDGHVYYWDLTNYLKPDEYENWSVKLYNQGDCKSFRVKVLSSSFHKKPMGGGTGDGNSHQKPEWIYPSPSTEMEVALDSVCDRVK